MSFSVRMVEFDDTPSRPLVSNGQCSPVKDDGSCGDGEEVLPGMTDLNGTAVLD